MFSLDVDFDIQPYAMMARTYFVEFDPMSVSQKNHLFVTFYVKYSIIFFFKCWIIL
jgi:hypothetical protein